MLNVLNVEMGYSRAKLRSRGGIGIKPALIRFGAEIEAILKRRPAVGPLFQYLRTLRAGGAGRRSFVNAAADWRLRACRCIRIGTPGRATSRRFSAEHARN